MHIAVVPPSGLQVAVLILLGHFIVAIGCKWLAAALGWPKEHFNVLGNSVYFALAAAILFAVPITRRFLASQLGRPGNRFLVEAAVVGFAKVAGPFALLGALALYHLTLSTPPDLAAALGVVTNRAPIDRHFYSPLGIFGATVLAVVVAPLMEEIVFRGLLYRSWERQWGWFPAMVATSIVFGLYHPSHILSAAMGSVIYICLLRRTGTLWAPILAHSIYNIVSSWPLAGQVLFVRKFEELPRLGSWWLEFAALAFVLVALPAYIWSARHPEPRPAVGPSTLEPIAESR